MINMLQLYIFILYNLFIYLCKANQIILNNNKLEINKKIIINVLPDGFVPINDYELNGPITTNREKDNGTKRNLFNMMRNEDNSFYYNYDEHNKLKPETSKKSEYFCEIHSSLRPEILKGYDLTCPKYYTIVIDKAFYGRYANDTINCENTYIIEKLDKIKNDCGYEPTKNVKNSCEGRSYCTLLPSNIFFKDHCFGIYKYLHIIYHCVKQVQNLILLKKLLFNIVYYYNANF